VRPLLLACLALAFLAAPALAQLTSTGTLVVRPLVPEVELAPGEVVNVPVRISGSIHCLLPTAPPDFDLSLALSRRTTSGEDFEIVWVAEPNRWRLDWSQRNALGDYDIEEVVYVTFYTDASPDAVYHDIVSWRGYAVGSGGLVKCNEDYAWDLYAAPLEVTTRPYVGADPGSVGRPDEVAQDADRFAGRSETPGAARALLGGVIGLVVIGGAAIVTALRSR